MNEFLHVLDIESLKFVDTLALKGDGPNEYRHLAFFMQYILVFTKGITNFVHL